MGAELRTETLVRAWRGVVMEAVNVASEIAHKEDGSLSRVAFGCVTLMSCSEYRPGW